VPVNIAGGLPAHGGSLKTDLTFTGQGFGGTIGENGRDGKWIFPCAIIWRILPAFPGMIKPYPAIGLSKDNVLGIEFLLKTIAFFGTPIAGCLEKAFGFTRR